MQAFVCVLLLLLLSQDACGQGLKSGRRVSRQSKAKRSVRMEAYDFEMPFAIVGSDEEYLAPLYAAKGVAKSGFLLDGGSNGTVSAESASTAIVPTVAATATATVTVTSLVSTAATSHASVTPASVAPVVLAAEPSTPLFDSTIIFDSKVVTPLLEERGSQDVDRASMRERVILRSADRASIGKAVGSGNAEAAGAAPIGSVIFSPRASVKPPVGSVIFSAKAEDDPPVGTVIFAAGSENASPEPVALAEPVVIASAAPVKPVVPAEPVKPVASAAPVKPVAPAEPVVIASAEPVKPIAPAEPVKPVASAAPPVGTVIFNPGSARRPSVGPGEVKYESSDDHLPVGTVLSNPAAGLPNIPWSEPVHSNGRPKKIRRLDEDLIGALDFDPAYAGPKIDLNSPVTGAFVRDTLIPFFKAGKLLDRKSAYSLFYRAFLVLSEEDSLHDIDLDKNQSILIFGDIHGQFHDFVQVFEREGYPSDKQKFLFNGDIVDRGAHSVECLLTLLAFKIAEPDNFYVTLGNHETMSVGKLQFFKESVRKYNTDEFFRLAHLVFRSLPVAFLIADEVFVAHGGVTPFMDLERIRDIDRLQPSVQDENLINDLVWSDPMDKNGTVPSHRGLGYLFGPDVTHDFIVSNNISLIVRSHQYKETGFSEQHGGSCVTVFSCPNYRGTMKNIGAYIRLDGDLNLTYSFFKAASLSGTESMRVPGEIKRGGTVRRVRA